MSPDNFPEGVRAMLSGIARNRIELEQYMDFLRNRAFRQTLIVHDSHRLPSAPPESRALRLRVASNATCDPGPSDPRSNDQVVFRRRGSVLTTSESLVKAAVQHLSKVWPLSVPFTELAATARAVVAGRPIPVDTEVMSEASKHLASTLLKCLSTGMIDFHYEPPSFTTTLSATPKASPLARVQAADVSSATNRLHEHVPLDDVQRFVLKHLDGSTDSSELVEKASQAVLANELLLFSPAGQKVTAPAEVLAILKDMMPHVVTSLSKRAFLVG